MHTAPHQLRCMQTVLGDKAARAPNTYHHMLWDAWPAHYFTRAGMRKMPRAGMHTPVRLLRCIQLHTCWDNASPRVLGCKSTQKRRGSIIRPGHAAAVRTTPRILGCIQLPTRLQHHVGGDAHAPVHTSPHVLRRPLLHTRRNLHTKGLGCPHTPHTEQKCTQLNTFGAAWTTSLVIQGFAVISSCQRTLQM